jgi:hypothetical protein
LAERCVATSRELVPFGPRRVKAFAATNTLARHVFA